MSRVIHLMRVYLSKIILLQNSTMPCSRYEHTHCFNLANVVRNHDCSRANGNGWKSSILWTFMHIFNLSFDSRRIIIPRNCFHFDFAVAFVTKCLWNFIQRSPLRKRRYFHLNSISPYSNSVLICIAMCWLISRNCLLWIYEWVVVLGFP